jgi:hypothetical protein
MIFLSDEHLLTDGLLNKDKIIKNSFESMLMADN